MGSKPIGCKLGIEALNRLGPDWLCRVQGHAPRRQIQAPTFGIGDVVNTMVVDKIRPHAVGTAIVCDRLQPA
ncbi:hypothetical protein D3C87_1389280 [compost metagenome]